MEATLNTRYIKIHAISSNPGNEVHEYYQRADLIVGFGEAPTQHALIGAGAGIDFSGDIRMYVKESAEDIFELLRTIQVLP